MRSLFLFLIPAILTLAGCGSGAPNVPIDLANAPQSTPIPSGIYFGTMEEVVTISSQGETYEDSVQANDTFTIDTNGFPVSGGTSYRVGNVINLNTAGLTGTQTITSATSTSDGYSAQTSVDLALNSNGKVYKLTGTSSMVFKYTSQGLIYYERIILSTADSQIYLTLEAGGIYKAEINVQKRAI